MTARCEAKHTCPLSAGRKFLLLGTFAVACHILLGLSKLSALFSIRHDLQDLPEVAGANTTPVAKDDAIQQRLRVAELALKPFLHPKVFFPNISASNPVKAFYFPLFPKIVVDDVARHFVVDGIEQSPFLQLIAKEEGRHMYHAKGSANLVWIASTANIWNRPGYWCHQLDALIREARDHRQNLTKSNDPNHLYWPIHLVNWGDMYTTFPCQRAFLSSPSSFYYHKRSIVWDRHWNATTNQPETGHIYDYSNNWTQFSAAPVHHIPFCVRSDLVQTLRSLAVTEFNYSHASAQSFLNWDVEASWHRPIDAAHFWPARGPGVDRGHDSPLSQLRDAVSRTLEDMGRRPEDLVTFAGLAGKAQHQGRTSVEVEYARRLLQCKIVVVAQKDEWEDHYRLMEALVSGAMVLSDVMLSLPQGLVDGKSLKFYHNQSHLKDLIQYYLHHDTERIQMAREGRRVALMRHRSWHRVEEIVFGRILSVDKFD